MGIIKLIMSAYSEIDVINPETLKSFSNRILFDTGNNFYSLISKDVLKEQNISYYPLNVTAYSIDLQPVSIIGKVELKFRFKNIDKIFKETFFIPHNTSRVINLSVRFLHLNKINLLFSENKVTIDNESFNLTSSVLNDSMCAEIKQIPIIKENLDFNKDKNDVPGVRTHRKSAVRNLDTQKFNLKLCENVTIYPGGTIAFVQAPTSSLYFKE